MTQDFIMKRGIYALAGLLVVAIVDLIINLLAAAIQEIPFANQFSQQSIWLLAGLALIGSLIAYWLGGKVTVSNTTSSSDNATPTENIDSATSSEPGTVTITRLKYFLSYIKIRGKDIHIKDSVAFGSRIDIDTKD